MRRIRSEQGFTLAEVVIAILVIGILAAIAIPRLQQVKPSANGEAQESALDADADVLGPWASQQGNFTAVSQASLSSLLHSPASSIYATSGLPATPVARTLYWTTANPGCTVGSATCTGHELDLTLCVAYFVSHSLLCATSALDPQGTTSDSRAATTRTLAIASCSSTCSNVYNATGTTSGTLTTTSASLTTGSWPPLPLSSTG